MCGSTTGSHASHFSGSSRRGAQDGGSVDARRVLSTAGVILPTSSRAAGFGAAIGHTLITPFGANEVRKSLGELRGIWRDAVAADASVGQGVRIAGVDLGTDAVSSSLDTEKRTSCRLGSAPRALVANQSIVTIGKLCGTYLL